MTTIRISGLDGEELNDALQIASSKGIDLQVEPRPEVVEPVTAILIGGGVLLAAKFVVDLMERSRRRYENSVDTIFGLQRKQSEVACFAASTR
jgi:hypothetical protein